MFNLKLGEEQKERYSKIVELKKHFHRTIYPYYINELVSLISQNIDIFNIEVSNDFVITVKIKKTSIKKYESYRHECQFYYGILNNIVYTFYMNHIEEIKQIKRQCNIQGSLSELLDIGVIPLYYNIATLGDNIICMYL